MARFMFVYRNDRDKYYQMSPEEMQKMGQKWQAWIAEGLQKGWMVDPGTGLKNEGCVVHADKVIFDGPFVEVKELIGGITIVQAETLEAAAEFARGCPILLRGGSVEVRPVWEPVK